jgi:hypothetical protein
MTIDEKAIARGKLLHEMTRSEGFGILLAEWIDRMAEHDHFVKKSKRGYTAEGMILSHLDRFQALRDLKEWIDDEIEAGAKELKKKSQEGPK